MGSIHNKIVLQEVTVGNYLVKLKLSSLCYGYSYSFWADSKGKMLSWSLIRKRFSANVSFCRGNNLMLLHVWDLPSQPEQCNQSTLIPFVGSMQLFFPAFDPAPVMWSCNVWERLGHRGEVPPSLLKGLCGQGGEEGWMGWLQPGPAPAPWASAGSSFCSTPPRSHRPALSTPSLFPVSISKSQWRSN